MQTSWVERGETYFSAKQYHLKGVTPYKKWFSKVIEKDGKLTQEHEW